MKAGISTACFYPKTPEQAADFLTAHQVENIEIFFNSFQELQKGYLCSLRSVLRQGGVKVLAVHPFTSGMEPILFFSDYERRVEDGLELYRHFFHAASELGAEILVLHGDRKESDCPLERYWERFLRLYRLGREFGVTVAQENVERCKSGSTEFLKGMKKALEDAAHFVLDVKQARRSGEDPLTLLNALGKNVCHIHMSDGGPLGDCLPIGGGEMDFDAFFSALQGLHYSGGVVLELYQNGYENPVELVESYHKLKGFCH